MGMYDHVVTHEFKYTTTQNCTWFYMILMSNRIFGKCQGGSTPGPVRTSVSKCWGNFRNECKLISDCQRKGFTSLRLCLTWPYSCCCWFWGAVSSGRSGLRCELRANKSENKRMSHKESRRERPQIDSTKEDLPDSSRRMSKAAWFELGGGPKKANKKAEQKLLSLRKDMAQWSCKKHIWFSFT